MTCQDLVELVTEYLEGALPAPSRSRFERQVRECPGCAEYLRQIRLTVRITGRLSEDTLEPATRDRLLAVFRHWKKGG